MAVNDIAVRFTENYYATKNEVSRELKISVIDGVWDKILSYRSPFCHYLAIRGIDKNQLRVCLCPTIASNLNIAENKLLRIVSESNKLNTVNSDKQYFLQSSLVKALQNVALSNLQISDENFIRSIILGQSRDSNLNQYLDGLRFVEQRYVNSIDEDFLAELYSKVIGDSELTSFYRTNELEDRNSSAVITRVYKCAPSGLIESMMDSLFKFVETSNVSPFCKAIISYYYIQFVKPFPTHNNEISVLFAKAILAHFSLGDFAIYLPFESLLNEDANVMSKLFYEVQTTSDVTYFLVYALKILDKEFDKILDSLAEYSTQIIKNDFFKLDEEPVVEEKVVDPAPVVEPSPTPAPTPRPVEPIREEQVISHPEAKPVEPIKATPTPKVEVEETTIVEKPSSLAVSYIPEELDEKTASRLEKHLLELDIRLSKAQAAFYARHCTLGMFYTIDQYKKSAKCVYETARTSMDKLVEFGYYKKDKYKKKFVYTPVNRK